jgi:hypothetical protein
MTPSVFKVNSSFIPVMTLIEVLEVKVSYRKKRLTGWGLLLM